MSQALELGADSNPPRLSMAQRAQLTDVLGAFLASRAVIWAVGVAVAAIVGVDPARSVGLDPLSHTAPFASNLANLLSAPAARFDSVWLLDVAQSGYSGDGSAAFFPLYPMLVAAANAAIGSWLVAGALVSALASLGGLYLLHALTSLDFGPAVARRTVWITAFFPAAFTFSAVYTEGIFLLLSVGAVYAGRTGRWRVAALAALAAGATRSAGVLLLVPLLVLYLYGPRSDRTADRPPAGLRPRYRVRADVAWLALVPVGLLAFVVYLGVVTGDPLATFGAEQAWDRVVAPLAAPAMAIVDAAKGLVDLVAGSHLLAGADNPRAMGALNLGLLGFLVLAGWLIARSATRLPAAYTGYAAVSLALPLSTPALGEPLMSLPRFMMVTFPLWIGLAIWADRPTRRRVALGASLTLLVVSTALFVAWVLAP